jgi:hypothetical protein
MTFKSIKCHQQRAEDPYKKGPDNASPNAPFSLDAIA